MKSERAIMAECARRDAASLQPGHTVAHVDDPERPDGEVVRVWVEDRIRLARTRWTRGDETVDHASSLWRWA